MPSATITVPSDPSGFYYWRVGSKDAFGYQGGSWSSVWSFATFSAPTAAVLASPATGSIAQPTTLVLNWTASSGDSSYLVQVSTDASFASTVTSQRGLVVPSATITVPSDPSGFYYWRVGSKDAFGYQGGSWSSVWSFATFSAPTAAVLASPATGSIAQPTTLVLNWTASSGDSSYLVQVSTDASFASTVTSQRGLVVPSATITVPSDPSGFYYWRVGSKDAFGYQGGSWSSVWSFATFSAPTAAVLASPATGSIAQPTTLVLNWTASSGDSSYLVQVSTDASFASTVTSQRGLVVPSATITVPSDPSGFYYWRVGSKDAFGYQGGSWSSVWSFATFSAPTAAVLASPATGSIAQPTTLVLNWTASSGDSSYLVQVSTDASFASTVTSQTGITIAVPSSAWRTLLLLARWLEGCLRVAGRQLVKRLEFRDVVQCAYRRRSCFADKGLHRSADNAGPELDRLFRRLSYLVQVSTDASFASTVTFQSGLTATSLALNGLSNYCIYYWHARTVNAGGNSSWSSVWSFTTAVNRCIGFGIKGWNMSTL